MKIPGLEIKQLLLPGCPEFLRLLFIR
jgi:hypothetical protein